MKKAIHLLILCARHYVGPCGCQDDWKRSLIAKYLGPVSDRPLLQTIITKQNIHDLIEESVWSAERGLGRSS